MTTDSDRPASTARATPGAGAPDPVTQTIDPAAMAAGRLSLVGIAAGAGALDAMGLLTRDLPSDLPVAYVLAHPLPRGGRNPLPILLADRTELSVVELSGHAVPRPGMLYVPPPGHDIVVEGGRIVTRPTHAQTDGAAPSADRLFESLARARGAAAIGIVLSGSGGDASYGVQAIREAGGITIAQRPITARHDGMPLSAIRTGCIDLELAPQEIGHHLARIAASGPGAPDAGRAGRGAVAALMDLLLARTGVDFRDYRDNTVRRRLARRMTALAIADLDHYVDHCRSHPAEVEALHRDLLISVTRFFRDPSAFDALAPLLARRLAERPADAPVRVWVAGCATGEEAYTVAILLAEALGGLDAPATRAVQIFATDIDDRALDVARRGIYPLSALGDVPPAFAGPYFRERRGMVEVVPALRRMILFSHHNVFQDPPFLRLDLVSLRNVLIYFKPPLQERVLARMHYALESGGLLLLGASESLSGLPERFRALAEGDLFEKSETGPEAHGAAELGFYADRRVPEAAPPASAAPREHADLSMFEQLARAIAPNGFVMSRDGRIQRVLGDVSAVTGLSEAAAPVLDASILRAPLHEEVARLVPIALRARQMREGQWHALPGPGFDEVRLDAYPIPDRDGTVTQALIAVRTRRRAAPPQAVGTRDAEAYVRELESELSSTRSALRQTVDELRIYNEELQSANEELQSSNEELQTVNEELETANEELQSTNEELITVNEEMQARSATLRSATADLDAMMTMLPAAVLVVDAALKVRRASARAQELFRIEAPSASGIPLSSCVVPDGMPMLTAFAREAFSGDAPRALRIRTGGIVRHLRASPHGAGTRDAVLLVVTEAVVSEGGPSDASPSHWSFDVDSGRWLWSDDALRLHGAAGDAPSLDQAWNIYHPEDRDRLRAAFDACRAMGDSYSIPARLRRPDGSVISVRSDGAAVRDAEGRIATVVGTVWSDADDGERWIEVYPSQ